MCEITETEKENRVRAKLGGTALPERNGRERKAELFSSLLLCSPPFACTPGSSLPIYFLARGLQSCFVVVQLMFSLLLTIFVSLHARVKLRNDDFSFMYVYYFLFTINKLTCYSIMLYCLLLAFRRKFNDNVSLCTTAFSC